MTKALLFASPCSDRFQRRDSRHDVLGNRLGFWLGRSAPWALQNVVPEPRRRYSKEAPRNLWTLLVKNVAPPDQALFKDAEFREAVIRDLREGL